MTNSSEETAGDTGISDDQLPEDLQPGDDNPLAEGLEPTETAGDLAPGELLQEGKHADQDGDEDGDVAERTGDDGSGDA